MREAVGYIRSFETHNLGSVHIQGRFIERYCALKGIQISKIFYDIGADKMRHDHEKWKAEAIGLVRSKYVRIFPGWDDMMVAASHGEIGVIIVDTKLRLYNGVAQKETLERICKEQDIVIMETEGTDLQSESSQEKVAIYHYSIQKGRRTSVPLKDIDTLYEAIFHRPDWEAAALYLDENDVRRNAYLELKGADGYSVVFVKSLYHIKRATTTFLSEMKYFKSKGVRIYSEEEGKLVYGDDGAKKWFNKPLRAVVYDRQRFNKEAEDQEILLKKFRIFARVKTNGWTIADVFIDRLNCGQTELAGLIRKAAGYDIVLVDTFGKIGDTVICLVQVLRKIQIPIYSLREGDVSLYE